jgi:hypothetical protein
MSFGSTSAAVCQRSGRVFLSGRPRHSAITTARREALTRSLRSCDFYLAQTPCWKNLVNGTTVTLGCNNVFGHDPPDAFTTTNYPDFLYDSTGRFVYVSLTKKF